MEKIKIGIYKKFQHYNNKLLNNRRRITNYITLLFGNGVIRGLNLISFSVLSRLIGPMWIGIFSIAKSYVGITAPLLNGGIPPLLLRKFTEISNLTNIQETYKFILKSFLKVCIIGYSVLLIGGIVLYHDNINISILIFILLTIELFNNIYNLEFTIAQYKNTFVKAINYQILFSLIWLSCITIGVLLSKIKIKVNHLLFLIGATYGIIIILINVKIILKEITLFFKLRIKEIIKYKVNSREWFSLLKDSFPYSLSPFISLIYYQSDIILLSKFNIKPIDIGYYASAYKIIGVFFIIPSLISTVTIREGYIQYNKMRSKFLSFYTQILLLISLIGVGVAMILLFSHKFLVRFILGNKFIESSSILNMLIPYLYLRFINYGAGDILTASYQQTLRLKMQFIAAGANVLTNFFLIPRKGIIGAVISTILSEKILLILYLTYSVNLIGKIYKSRWSYKQLYFIIIKVFTIFFILLIITFKYDISLGE